MMWAWVRLSLLSMGLVGCARGTGDLEVDDLPAQSPDAGADAAAEDAGDTPDSATALDAGDGEPDAGEPDAGEPDAGDPCAATTTCAAPVMLGMVRGDEGADTLELAGAGDAFVAVFLKEQSSSPFRIPVKIRAHLTSPTGANFDLYMYAEQNSCGTVTQSSTTDFVDMVSGSWDEGLNANDDSRNIVFEVRHDSGQCSAAEPWVLEVTGNN
jgi:hypothetical protein